MGRVDRLAGVFWVQSLVREDANRTLVFDVDQSIQRAEKRGHAD